MRRRPGRVSASAADTVFVELGVMALLLQWRLRRTAAPEQKVVRRAVSREG